MLILFFLPSFSFWELYTYWHPLRAYIVRVCTSEYVSKYYIAGLY